MDRELAYLLHAIVCGCADARCCGDEGPPATYYRLLTQCVEPSPNIDLG